MNSHSRHLPAEERRAATVAAVVELAARQNPSDITTAAIAAHMGVTQGALFKHFASKDAILQAVMEWVAENLLARVDAAAGAAPSPLAAIEAVFMAHANFAADYPGVPRMLFGELQRGEPTPAKQAVQGALRRYAERLQRLIEHGKEKGELPVALDTEAAIQLFIGSIQGLVVQSLLAGDVERIRRDAPRVFAIYQLGIRSTR